MKKPYILQTITAVCLTMLLTASLAKADVNVLIIGSEQDSSKLFWNSSSKAFSPAKIKTELQKILNGAGLGTANVVLEDRYKYFNGDECFNLANWFYWPYPADAEFGRWQNLRGESGTQWDYVVLIDDPFTMEEMPGLYAHGVAKVSQEVAKATNGAETVLLMPWPAETSQSSVDHYKEVVYRVGRSGGFKVAPAALARQDAVSAGHAAAGLTPADGDGAYICAASIYSRIWHQSAKDSTYVYDDPLADSVFTTVTNNVGAPQYSGTWSFQHPNPNRHDPFGAFNVKSRVLNPGKAASGSSTEDLIANGCRNAIGRAGIKGQYDPQFWFINGRVNMISFNTPGAKDYRNRGNVPSFGYVFPWEETNQDLSLGGILFEDIYRVNVIAGEWHQYRIIPHRILLGGLLKNDPNMQVYRGGHMYPRATAIGAYMVTLVSGRCPVDSTLAEVVPFKEYPYAAFDWMAQKVGYEMAWNVSTLQVRAPGFKVVPKRETIGFEFSSTATVEFINKPEADVTVTISSASSNITITPSTLTFTPENYNVKQQVSVMANPGAVPDTALSLVYNTTSDDEVYNALSDEWSYRINRAPTAINGSLTAYSELESPVTLRGSDPNSEYLTGVIVDPPSHGTVTVTGAVAVYTSDAGYTGPDSFTFKMSDGVDRSANTATMSITVEGQRPLDFNLLNNPSAELTPLTNYDWVDVNGSWATAAGGVNGSRLFYNTKSWSQDLYQDVDVSRYAAKINNGGQQFKISGSGYPGNDRATVIMTFRDAAGNVLLTYEWVGYNQNLWLSFEATLTAPVNTATIRVLLRTANANGSSNDAKLDALSLVALGNEPVVDSQSVRILKDQPKSLTLTGSDADGDALTYTIVDAPANGVLDVSALPDVIYTPNPDYVGTDSFTFKASDGIADSALGTISITVDAANGPPTANTGLDKAVTITTSLPLSPADLSPTAWYDAADTTTITASSGAVSQWSDKSGNGNHATQGTSGNRPTTGGDIGGRNAISFNPDVNSQYLATGLAQLTTVSMYIVADATQRGPGQLSHGPIGANTDHTTAGFGWSLEAYNSGVPINSPGYNASSVYGNGVLGGTHNFDATLLSHQGSSLTTNNKNYHIGDSRQGNTWTGSRYKGLIGEIIICPVEHDADTRMKVEGYLAHKWGLVGSLPTGHPYQIFAPGETGATVVLDGSSVTDPDDDALTQTWTVVSAPTGGTAVFDDPTLLHPTVIFDTAGTYVLRITVDDGLETDSDEINIYVLDAVTADAGPDQTVADNDNNGSENVTLDGSSSIGGGGGWITSYVWNDGTSDIATGVSPTVTLAVGTHTITLTATDDGGATDTDTVTITVTGPNTPPAVNAGTDQTVTFTGTSASVFVQDGGAQGLISVEAEHFHRNTAGGSDQWVVLSETAASNGQSMDTNLDDGTNANPAPQLSFDVSFNKTGTHYLWIRGRAFPRSGDLGNADSVHAGLNGALVTSTTAITGFGTSYGWTNALMAGGVVTINVPSTGIHSVEIFMREDGFVCDKMILTTDSTFTPSANGPAESDVQSIGGATAVLDGASVTDADGDALSHTWTVVSAPADATAVFDDESLVNATVTLDTVGAYVLRLTADDGIETVFDEIRITVTDGSNTLANWIGGYELGGLTGVGDDYDGDGIANALENYFGTDPSQANPGLTETAVQTVDGTTTFTFVHPLNDSPASDIITRYRWSKDLSAFHEDSATDSEGTTVNFTRSAPVDGRVTVTATIEGTATDRVFVQLVVTQN